MIRGERRAVSAAAMMLAGGVLSGCATAPPTRPPDPQAVRVTIVDGIGDCRYHGRRACVRVRVRNGGASPLALATFNDTDEGPMLYPYDVWVEIRDDGGAWRNADVLTQDEYDAYDSLVVLKPGRSAFLVYFQDHAIPPGSTYRLVLRALDSETKYASTPAVAGPATGD